MTNERKLLSILSRNWLWLLAAVGLGAAAGLYVSSRMEPSYESRAEIFVKFGNEYTVPAAFSGSDRLLVDVDFPVAMNGEIQILTSLAVIDEALKTVPHPMHGPSPFPVSKLVSVFNVENSPIMVATVVDHDKTWSAAFLTRLLEVYQSRRAELFQRPDTEKFLADRKTELSNSLTETRARLKALSAQTGSPDSTTSNPEAEQAIVEADYLLKIQESVMAEMLRDLYIQELKLNMLSASANQVELLTPPFVIPEPVGPSKTEFISLFILGFALAASAGVMLREAFRD